MRSLNCSGIRIAAPRRADLVTRSTGAAYLRAAPANATCDRHFCFREGPGPAKGRLLQRVRPLGFGSPIAFPVAFFVVFHPSDWASSQRTLNGKLGHFWGWRRSSRNYFLPRFGRPRMCGGLRELFPPNLITTQFTIEGIAPPARRPRLEHLRRRAAPTAALHVGLLRPCGVVRRAGRYLRCPQSCLDSKRRGRGVSPFDASR